MGKRYGCLIGLLAICLMVFGCGKGTPPDYFAYRAVGFCAEAEGEMRGEAFGAKLTVEPSGAGWRVTVEYLRPDVLTGIRLTALCGEDGALAGEAEVVYEDMSLMREASALEGLFLPATCLLSYGEISTVQRTDAGYVLTFSDGAALTLDAGGAPIAFVGEAISFNLVWREPVWE